MGEIAPLDLSILILTFNEERHIGHCIASVEQLARHILVVDSYSTDGTVAIASQLGAKVLQNRWVNHATQLNWALDSANLPSEWVMRLDADEIVTPELALALRTHIPSARLDTSGFTVNRRIYFLGRWIKHGGVYPIRQARIWRRGKGRCENRWMDEHMVIAGKVGHLDHDISDINLNAIGWWTEKHNNYATLEAIELLLMAYPHTIDPPGVLAADAARKRWLKERVYAKLPLGFRAIAYFLYRYVVRLGFLDGRAGLLFHLLQGLWYRALVDAKIYEIKAFMKSRNLGVREAIEQYSGHRISEPPTRK